MIDAIARLGVSLVLLALLYFGTNAFVAQQRRRRGRRGPRV